MHRDELERALARLRAELARLDAEVGDTHPELRTLIADIERELGGRDDGGAGSGHGLRQRIEQFEVEHPRATALLNELMVILSGLGI